MTSATLLEILIAPSPASAMESRASVRAFPGRGLDGDRYLLGTGTFAKSPPRPDHELTLIESEAIEAFARESGIAFTTMDARRNLVTRGIGLNALVGVEFSIGEARIRGLRLCEPCNYLAQRTDAAILRGLVHRGGLRAQILSEGVLRVGDPITCPTSASTTAT